MKRPYATGLKCRVCGCRFERRRPYNGRVPTVCYDPECRAKAHRRAVREWEKRSRVARAGGEP